MGHFRHFFPPSGPFRLREDCVRPALLKVCAFGRRATTIWIATAFHPTHRRHVMSNALTIIPLCQLKRSKTNVRKTDASADIEQLVASIEANGLLENLIVRK